MLSSSSNSFDFSSRESASIDRLSFSCGKRSDFLSMNIWSVSICLFSLVISSLGIGMVSYLKFLISLAFSNCPSSIVLRKGSGTMMKTLVIRIKIHKFWKFVSVIPNYFIANAQ